MLLRKGEVVLRKLTSPYPFIYSCCFHILATLLVYQAEVTKVRIFYVLSGSICLFDVDLVWLSQLAHKI